MILLRLRAAAVIAAAALALDSASAASALGPAAVVRWVSTPGKEASAYVEVAGLTSTLLAGPLTQLVFVQAIPDDQLEKGSYTSVNMVGRYEVSGGVLRFTPQFPLAHGLIYRATAVPGTSRSATADFRLPSRPTTTPARILAIYPGTDVLPENQLKFYIHFSAPMNGGNSYDHIHLRGPDGKEDTQAFLKIGQELWDPTMTRLTLLMDPGRIKRGVSLNLELGPALEEGKSYTLAVDSAWKDSNGQPLATGHTKSFVVVAADRTPIDTAKWRVAAPKAATRDALYITFPEPLDHALLMRLVRILDGKGVELTGDAETDQNEQRFIFRPEKNWQPGRYDILVYATLEDLAGNKVGKPFDVDVFEKVDRELPSETVRLAFEVK